jgi:hypothetical protein
LAFGRNDARYRQPKRQSDEARKGAFQHRAAATALDLADGLDGEQRAQVGGSVIEAVVPIVIDLRGAGRRLALS